MISIKIPEARQQIFIIELVIFFQMVKGLFIAMDEKALYKKNFWVYVEFRSSEAIVISINSKASLMNIY